MQSTLGKVLLGLLGLDIVLGVLVTPAGGMDPRPPSGASALTWACVGLFMVGMILCIGAIVQLVRGKPSGFLLAFVGPFLFYGVVIADRTDMFHAQVAPPAIRTLEWCVAGVSAVVIAVAATGRKGTGAKPGAAA